LLFRAEDAWLLDIDINQANHHSAWEEEVKAGSPEYNEHHDFLANSLPQIPELARPAICDQPHSDVKHGHSYDTRSSKEKFSAALRNYTQGLESVKISGLDLQKSFFRPFLYEGSSPMAVPKWQWEKLKNLVLEDSRAPIYSVLGPIKLPPEDLLIAVGKAAVAMPVLASVRITTAEGQLFWAERFGTFHVVVTGFEKDAKREIWHCITSTYTRKASPVRPKYDLYQ
jgi:hypothetical protein